MRAIQTFPRSQKQAFSWLPPSSSTHRQDGLYQAPVLEFPLDTGNTDGKDTIFFSPKFIQSPPGVLCCQDMAGELFCFSNSVHFCISWPGAREEEEMPKIWQTSKPAVAWLIDGNSLGRKPLHSGANRVSQVLKDSGNCLFLGSLWDRSPFPPDNWKNVENLVLISPSQWCMTQPSVSLTLLYMLEQTARRPGLRDPPLVLPTNLRESHILSWSLLCSALTLKARFSGYWQPKCWNSNNAGTQTKWILICTNVLH